MSERAQSIAEHLDLDRGSCLALVGAGGKTTTMLSLAADLRLRRRSVLVTTTTKIWPPHRIPLVCRSEVTAVEQALVRSFQRSSIVALGDSIGPEGKLHGVEPAVVCDLVASKLADVVLCEADGAAGRAVKAHGPGEPVIPSCSNLLLVVAGLDAVERPVGRETVHRLEEFCRLTGASPSNILTPEHLAVALAAAGRYGPDGARVVYVLNKVDDPQREAAAGEVVRALRESLPAGTALLTTRGSAVNAVRWA